LIDSAFITLKMIDVIIITHNRKRLLEKCLESLISQDFTSRYNIIVFNNHSSDSTDELFKKQCFKKIRIIKTAQHLNLTACKNLALEKTTEEIVAFIDDDCIASKNWLSIISTSLPDYDIASGPVLPIPKTKFPWWWKKSLNWLIGINPNNEYLPLGSNIAFRKSALIKLLNDKKLQSPNINFVLPYVEDYYRIKKSLELGFSLKINQNMFVFHYIPKKRLTIPYLVKRSYREGFSRATWEQKKKFSIHSLTNLLAMPLRLILSFDINYLMRIIMHISYATNYIRLHKTNNHK